MPRSSLRGLRAFCAAARAESFRQAADELHLTASAVSHQIRNLEAELGETLFERTGRAVVLTAAGRALFAELDPLLGEVERVLGRYREERSRSLRVSVQPFFASEVFVPRLRDFASRHPDIDLQVDTSDESSEVHPPGADLSIRLFRAPPAGLRADLLAGFRLLPAGSVAFQGRMVVEDNVIRSDFPLLVHEVRPDAWQRWAEHAGIRLPSRPRVTRLNSMIAVVRAAEQGLGAALVPVPLSDAWFRSGKLVPLFPTQLEVDAGYYLCCPEQDAEADGVRELRAWALEAFAPLGATRGRRPVPPA